MNRTEIVKERAEELSRLNDKELVTCIVSYFEQNATMPGEKRIKETAKMLLSEIGQGFALAEPLRFELIEEFSSLCVKSVKIKGVRAKNETKKNEELDLPKASDMPMVLKDSHYIPVNTMKDIYEMSAVVTDKTDDVSTAIRIGDENNGFILGFLPKGFEKNHRSLNGMKGTVVAADYSNSKFKNMSYELLIDLAQNLVA